MNYPRFGFAALLLGVVQRRGLAQANPLLVYGNGPTDSRRLVSGNAFSDQFTPGIGYR